MVFFTELEDVVYILNYQDISQKPHFSEFFSGTPTENIYVYIVTRSE